MEGHHALFSLPPDYDESALFLLVQGPKVLYVYWELSPGLKEALNEKGKVQIRLNIEGRGPCCTRDADLSKKSDYFSDVEPGLSYNCEIGIFNSGNQFYPLLRSNSVTTPHDRPSDGHSSTEDHSSSSFGFTISSWALRQDK